jgi:CHAT domain
VSTLDLQGTWLVTLSACDTGSGEARAGEGVMGLRRGFVEAGTQNLLMTLWPISDEVTVQIMSDFYDAAHKTGNAPEALAEVQRRWLLKLRTDKTDFRSPGVVRPDDRQRPVHARPYITVHLALIIGLDVRKSFPRKPVPIVQIDRKTAGMFLDTLSASPCMSTYSE